MSERHLSYQALVSWFVPVMLTAGVGALGWIGINMQRLSETLVVIAYRVDNHEGRLSNLEALFLRPEKP